MAYPIYYPTGCDANIPPHYCNNCEKIEKARIRSVAFVAKDWVFSNPEDPNEWEDGIAQKKIIVIPRTNGSFDGGSEVESAGYGDQSTNLDGYNFQAVY